MIKTTILKLIDNDLKTIEMNLVDDSWRTFVPSDPGWYFIERNTPPDIFKDVVPPQGERHYNIPQKLMLHYRSKTLEYAYFHLRIFFILYIQVRQRILNHEQENMCLVIQKLAV